MGRRRYLPDLTSDNRQRREMAERMALNAPIQGSAADVIKVAMLRVSAALRAAGLKSRMLLQVHDELIFEAAPGELDALTTLVKTRWAPPTTCASRLRCPPAPAAAGRKRPTNSEQAMAGTVGKRSAFEEKSPRFFELWPSCSLAQLTRQRELHTLNSALCPRAVLSPSPGPR